MTKIAQARDRRDVRRHEQEVAALRRHHAELGGRRLRAHAEEAQRRADQDDLAEAQGQEHEDGRDAVERQVAPDQRAVGDADGAAGLHEFLAHDADRRAARHPRHVGHRGHHQRDHHGGEAGAEDRRHREPDQDRREGQHHVDQAHDPAVERADRRRRGCRGRRPAGRRSGRRPGPASACCACRRSRGSGCRGRYCRCRTSARRWAAASRCEVGEVGIVGRDQRREDRGQHDQRAAPRWRSRRPCRAPAGAARRARPTGAALGDGGSSRASTLMTAAPWDRDRRRARRPAG